MTHKSAVIMCSGIQSSAISLDKCCVQGEQAVVLCTLLGVMKVTNFQTPDASLFTSSTRLPCTAAYIKAAKGWLYPLPTALVFIGTPTCRVNRPCRPVICFSRCISWVTLNIIRIYCKRMYVQDQSIPRMFSLILISKSPMCAAFGMKRLAAFPFLSTFIHVNGFVTIPDKCRYTKLPQVQMLAYEM